ncbi:AAA family ATPase [Halococcus sp. IIIV-5B]|uniref:AAA family ATPase n=1 Tax=Halococcus sp. IIIV-5B TaxID=2321230 RepID=UPI000E76B5A6|nr:SMC family ATPase [Halococcus sp. IIIV-5B]RJT08083.1 SMC family ATPase [Halococcus sp. IIIV-5B]
MKITQVALEDIKSYGDRTEVPMSGGVTAVLGENGAGKSTVQEAIGYALFDSLPFANKDFVREGASSGSVEVTFEQNTTDGTETYRVTRYAGRSSYGVTRKVGNEWVAQDIDSKNALVEWLCARFGLADGDELSDLWTSCIGVPQTRFLADFAQTARGRTTTFDALLDIDAYEESFSGTLKDVPDTIEAERTAVREDVRELTGEVRALPERRETVADLSAEIESLDAKIEEAETELAAAEERYDELAAVEDRIDDLETDLRTAETRIETTEDKLETARRELGQAQAAHKQVEAAREGHEHHLDAADREETLEARGETRDDLRERKREREGEIRRLDDRIEGLEADVETHETASATMDDLANAKARHDDVEKRIRENERAQDTIEDLAGDIEALTDDIEDVVADLMETHTVIRRIERERANAPDIEGVESKLGDAKAEHAALGTERDRLRERLDRLEDADADATCPTCGQSLTADHRRETIAEREERLDEIETERTALAARIEELQGRLDAANEVQRRVDTLSLREEKRDDLAEELGELKGERAAARDERERLDDDLADLDALRETRDDLAADHTAYLQAKTRAEDTADAEAELEATREQIEDEHETLAGIEDELREYEGLDDRLAEVRATLAETEDDHETFVTHRQQAETVEDRKNAVEELEADLEAIEATREEHEEALSAAREAFDADEYAALDVRTTELTSDLGGYQSRKSAREDDRAEAVAAVERLEATLEERTKQVERLKELAADHRFAVWVRQNVRAAGPRMREVITSRIGERANQLFRAVRGRATESLEWTSDYEIVVTDADVRKSFDTLSGGEKMAAALAVRLAILEQLSSIGVAFLDEPTANLDTQKKRNLVEQLDGLDAFDQLVVISHDTAFETMTEYAVTVTKDRQTTAVEAE